MSPAGAHCLEQEVWGVLLDLYYPDFSQSSSQFHVRFPARLFPLNAKRFLTKVSFKMGWSRGLNRRPQLIY